MKAIVTLITILILGLAISGQKTRPQPAPTPKAVLITIEGATGDGKAVLLRSDGTWVYDESKSKGIASVPKTLSVEFQSALIFQSGEVVPVPRTTFYLLDRSVGDIIATPELKRDLIAELKMTSPTGTSYLADQVEKGNLGEIVGYATRYAILAPQFHAAVQPLLRSAARYTAQSDFQGSGSFQGVSAGEYYLFGWTEIRKKVVAWNVRVVVDGSQQKIILDTNNRL